jgi:hypothetical protein
VSTLRTPLAPAAPPRQWLRGVAAVVTLGFIVAWIVTARHILEVGVEQESATRLTAAARLVDDLRQSTRSSLLTQARLLAEDSRIKATLATEGVDVATVADILGDVRRSLRGGFLLILSAEGRVFAQAGADPLAGLDLSGATVVRDVQTTHDAVAGTWILGGKLADVGVAPIRQGEAVLAYLVRGQLMDKVLLTIVGSAAGVQVVLVSGEEVLWADGAVVNRELPRLSADLDALNSTRVTLQGEAYLARSQKLTAAGSVQGATLVFAAPLASYQRYFQRVGWLLWVPAVVLIVLTLFMAAASLPRARLS